MSIEAQAHPAFLPPPVQLEAVPLHAPLPELVFANLIDAGQTRYKELSLIVDDGNDPRLNVTGYDEDEYMVITTAENYSAKAQGVSANLGDAVNAWRLFADNQFILDTQTELDACAGAIVADDRNDYSLERDTNALTNRLVIPRTGAAVCYNGIEGQGANPQEQRVQATVQAVYEGLQKQEEKDKEKTGFLKGVGVTLGLIGAGLGVFGLHKLIRRLAAGHGSNTTHYPPPPKAQPEQLNSPKPQGPTPTPEPTPKDTGPVRIVDFAVLGEKLSYLWQVIGPDSLGYDLTTGEIFKHDGVNDRGVFRNKEVLIVTTPDLLTRLANAPQDNPFEVDDDAEVESENEGSDTGEEDTDEKD